MSRGRRITSDVGRYTIVPRWLSERLRGEDGVLRLYVELGLVADDETRSATRTRRELAETMGCSLDTVDRRVARLVEIDALHVESNDLPGSSGRAPSTFQIRIGRPGEQLELAADDPTRTHAPSRTDAGRGTDAATRTDAGSLAAPIGAPGRTGAAPSNEQGLSQVTPSRSSASAEGKGSADARDPKVLAEALLDPSSSAQHFLVRLVEVDERWEEITPAALIKFGQTYGASVVITALGYMREEGRGGVDPYPYLESVCVRIQAERIEGAVTAVQRDGVLDQRRLEPTARESA